MVTNTNLSRCQMVCEICVPCALLFDLFMELHHRLAIGRDIDLQEVQEEQVSANPDQLHWLLKTCQTPMMVVKRFLCKDKSPKVQEVKDCGGNRNVVLLLEKGFMHGRDRTFLIMKVQVSRKPQSRSLQGRHPHKMWQVCVI